MRCTEVRPAGTQLWHKNTLGGGGTKAAYCSTLAVYIYDVAETPKLEKILTGPDKTICSIAWSPTDPNTLAMAVADDDNNIVMWDLAAEVETKRLAASGKAPAVFLQWNANTSMALVSVSAHGVVSLVDTAAGTARNMQWCSHVDSKAHGIVGRSLISSPVTSVELAPRAPARLLLGFESGHVIGVGLDGVGGANDATILFEAPHRDDAVAEARWDPLSDNYLIVALRSGTMRLYDTTGYARSDGTNNAPKPAMSFDRAVGGVRALAWVPGAPGDFVTVSATAGGVRLWNVSQPAPKDVMKTQGKASGGFQNAIFIAGEARLLCAFKSGSVRRPPTDRSARPHTPDRTPNRTSHPTPLALQVGILEMPTRKWNMICTGAHTDTVFSAAFQPANADRLATCSFDGSVRLWRTPTNTLEKEMVGEDVGVLYSLVWAPEGCGDEEQIATCSSRGLLGIWNTATGVLLRRINFTTGNGSEKREVPLFCVDWAPDGKTLAVASLDNACHVVRVDGTVVRRLKHPAGCFGVAFCPLQPGVLASSCADGAVRVWELGSDYGAGAAAKTQSATPTATFKGHEKRTFMVAWSPLLAHALLSGSDDFTVRLWDTRAPAGTAGKVLSGHTRNVRALHWHKELEWLAMSGAWDGTIRLWDTRTCACVRVIAEHHADIYCLVSHPARPFALLSTSRDTTVRTWFLDDAATPLLLPVLLGDEVGTVRGVAGDGAAENGELRLCGAGSRRLEETLKATASVPGDISGRSLARYTLLFDFFMPPRGVRNLWQLAAAAAPPAARTDDDLEVAHGVHLLDAERALLVQLRSALDGGSRRINGKRMKADEIAQLAAATALKLGDLKTYCEVQADQGGDGRWAAALAMAPAVGVDFWREMCARRARELAAAGAEPLLSAPFLVATGDARGAVHHFLTAGDGADARARRRRRERRAAAAARLRHRARRAGRRRRRRAALARGAQVAAVHVAAAGADARAARASRLEASGVARRRRRVAAAATAAAGPGGGGGLARVCGGGAAAAEYMESGRSVLAACCYLAHGDGARAVGGLLRAHELELALAVTRALGLDGGDALLAALARRAERLGCWELALRALQAMRDPGPLLPLLAARHARDVPPGAAPDALYVAASLPSAASYARRPKPRRRRPPTSFAASSLAATRRRRWRTRCPSFTRRSPPTTAPASRRRRLLALLRAADVDDASGVEPPQRKALLACSAFEACLQATWRGYTPIVLPLLRAAVTLTAAVARDPLGTVSALALPPAALDALSLQVAAYRCRLALPKGQLEAELGARATAGTLSASHAAALAALVEERYTEPPPAHSSREVCATGAALPSSSKQRGRVSSVSGEKVLGAAVVLSDASVQPGPFVLSLSEALMWARTHGFSPLHNGKLLNPF